MLTGRCSIVAPERNAHRHSRVLDSGHFAPQGMPYSVERTDPQVGIAKAHRPVVGHAYRFECTGSQSSHISLSSATGDALAPIGHRRPDNGLRSGCNPVARGGAATPAEPPRAKPRATDPQVPLERGSVVRGRLARLGRPPVAALQAE